MYDQQVFIRKGEKRPDYATVSVSSGTVTIDSATFQLLNPDHSSVDLSGDGGTDFSSPVSATVDSSNTTAYYNLADTDTDLLTVTTYYIGQFVLTVSSDDSIARIEIVEVQIWVSW